MSFIKIVFLHNEYAINLLQLPDQPICGLIPISGIDSDVLSKFSPPYHWFSFQESMIMMTDTILMKDILKSRYTDFFIVWTKWWVFMLCYNSFILQTKTKLCKKSKSVINLSILGYFDDGHQAVPKWAEWPFCPSVLRHSGCVTHTPTHLTIKHTSKYHVHSVLHTPTYQIGGHRLLFYVVVFLMTDAFWWRTSVMKIMKLWFDQRMLMLYDLLHLLTHCPHKPNTHVS